MEDNTATAPVRQKIQFAMWQDVAIIASLTGGKNARPMEATAEYIGRSTHDIVSRIRKLKEIARIHGILDLNELPVKAVHNGRICIPPRKWSPEEYAELEKQVNTGEFDLTELAVMFRRPENTLKKEILSKGFDLSKVKGQLPPPKITGQQALATEAEVAAHAETKGDAPPANYNEQVLKALRENNELLQDIRGVLFNLWNIQRDEVNTLKRSLEHLGVPNKPLPPKK